MHARWSGESVMKGEFLTTKARLESKPPKITIKIYTR
jgi:hypothetical protein